KFVLFKSRKGKKLRLCVIIHFTEVKYLPEVHQLNILKLPSKIKQKLRSDFMSALEMSCGMKVVTTDYEESFIQGSDSSDSFNIDLSPESYFYAQNLNMKRDDFKEKEGNFLESKDTFMAFKCHSRCFKSEKHQSKHNVDISSALGIFMTKKDVVDDSYIKKSL
ncbi:CLUMA_CG020946, isoform A, partial [Clunio marinus]